ncbi:dienelactone hydrolase family protein [Sphaerisporangium sp. TRM90804]|uniref:dienelactone hydrolase family protein n=1 Tax=Sphaerisporangium sp. TRM90804 TaxID=3031113 RepID=UPI00244B2846|nr:dienelactone hydrolase family protein [Sphaerisporangium sp. TRM90804]MDH2429023.1 dienelactone hydrolase family protein [Sphaerisporangium sp. TRM90804]
MVERRCVTVDAAGVALTADVAVPSGAQGVVLFAHGSGSGRHSPRNRYVADRLNAAGLATVLVDLLTPEEEDVDALTGALRFDIDLLAARVIAITDRLGGLEPLAGLAVGLFGASTGAAAALVAAAERPGVVRAVVSRGGRPDLAGDHLGRVTQPTLLVVGERDPAVLELNREAMERMVCETDLVTVAGATHLFQEPGALDRVASPASGWFSRHLARPGARPTTGRPAEPDIAP